MENYNNEEMYLVCIFNISDNTKMFSKKKVLKKLVLLLGKMHNNNYYVLRENHKSILQLKQQGFIQEEENLIFQFVYKKDTIELINLIDFCSFPTNYEKVFSKVNNLSLKLWKSLPKCTNCEISNLKNSFKNNEDCCICELKQNDIFRLGDIKFIIREFHTITNINNNNNCDDCSKKENSRLFSILLKPYFNEYCDICKKNEQKDTKDDPLLKFCECNKYRHFKCMKKKFKEILIKDENNNGCIRYYIKTNCFYCNKFIPLSFYIKENKDYNLYELIDIPKDNNQEYLILETVDFLNEQEDYIKYIYYIKLREKAKDKNIDTILIGSNRRKDKCEYQYNKLIEIGESSVSNHHALLDYDIEEKNLTIRNISNTHNTLVLQNKFVFEKNKNNKLLMELGNIQIESHLISDKEEFSEIKYKMENNNSGLFYTRNNDIDNDEEIEF